MNYVIWLLTIILYSPILYQLYNQRWQTIDYTHAYFILPVSLWLAWRKRAALKSLAQTPQTTGIILSTSLIIAGIFMFILGWRNDYLFISSLSLIPLAYGLILYLYGENTAKALSFPILYLLLLVPPPLGVLDSITLPMRYGISVLTEIILKTCGLPIARNGLLLSIGGHEIYMGAPCSGFRSLITMIALGLVYIYINKISFKNKVILLFSILPIALTGNLIRVISICLVTFCYGDEIGKKFHDISGFIIFLFMVMGLIVMENILEKKKNEN